MSTVCIQPSLGIVILATIIRLFSWLYDHPSYGMIRNLLPMSQHSTLNLSRRNELIYVTSTVPGVAKKCELLTMEHIGPVRKCHHFPYWIGHVGKAFTVRHCPLSCTLFLEMHLRGQGTPFMAIQVKQMGLPTNIQIVLDKATQMFTTMKGEMAAPEPPRGWIKIMWGCGKT